MANQSLGVRSRCAQIRPLTAVPRLLTHGLSVCPVPRPFPLPHSGATIDQGSCMYGPLPNSMVSTGVNIAALSDKDADYAGSCGWVLQISAKRLRMSIVLVPHA